jgi:hypothetical protein
MEKNYWFLEEDEVLLVVRKESSRLMLKKCDDFIVT